MQDKCVILTDEVKALPVVCLLGSINKTPDRFRICEPLPGLLSRQKFQTHLFIRHLKLYLSLA